MYQLHK